MTQRVPQIMKQGRVVPWFYLAPAILLMSFFIVYPMINTIGISLKNKDGTASAATTCKEGQSCWGVFENYHYALTAELDTTSAKTTWDSFWTSSYGNNIKWVVLMVLFSQPGQETAFSRMEDLVFEDRSGALH